MPLSGALQRRRRSGRVIGRIMIRSLSLLSLTAALSLLASCVHNPTIPDATAVEQSYQNALQDLASEFKQLEADLAAGRITPEQYELEKRALHAYARKKSVDRLWARHEMDQTERKGMGLPTPDAPVMLEAPRPGVGGNGSSGYTPFNQRDNGRTGTASTSMQQIGGMINERRTSSGY
jgi:hypothetical protein